MLGPRGVAFDNDDALEGNDDEDLKNDPVSTMDMRVRPIPFLPFLWFLCSCVVCVFDARRGYEY